MRNPSLKQRESDNFCNQRGWGFQRTLDQVSNSGWLVSFNRFNSFNPTQHYKMVEK